MADNDDAAPGTIAWTDLTVPDAEKLRDFYREVVGWEAEGLDMGGYEDFNMLSSVGEAVAGICHARGANADLPPQWLVYIVVKDLDESLRRCGAGGGVVVVAPSTLGAGGYGVIRDPAGAVCALYQAP